MARHCPQKNLEIKSCGKSGTQINLKINFVDTLLTKKPRNKILWQYVITQINLEINPKPTILVRIPPAFIRHGAKSWKIFPTWTGVFLALVQVGGIATKVLGSVHTSTDQSVHPSFRTWRRRDASWCGAWALACPWSYRSTCHSRIGYHLKVALITFTIHVWIYLNMYIRVTQKNFFFKIFFVLYIFPF